MSAPVGHVLTQENFERDADRVERERAPLEAHHFEKWRGGEPYNGSLFEFGTEVRSSLLPEEIDSLFSKIPRTKSGMHYSQSSLRNSFKMRCKTKRELQADINL